MTGSTQLPAELGTVDVGDRGETVFFRAVSSAGTSAEVGPLGGVPPKDNATWDSDAGCVSSKANRARWGVASDREQKRWRCSVAH